LEQTAIISTGPVPYSSTLEFITCHRTPADGAEVVTLE